MDSLMISTLADVTNVEHSTHATDKLSIQMHGFLQCFSQIL